MYSSNQWKRKKLIKTIYFKKEYYRTKFNKRCPYPHQDYQNCGDMRKMKMVLWLPSRSLLVAMHCRARLVPLLLAPASSAGLLFCTVLWRTFLAFALLEYIYSELKLLESTSKMTVVLLAARSVSILKQPMASMIVWCCWTASCLGLSITNSYGFPTKTPRVY